MAGDWEFFATGVALISFFAAVIVHMLSIALSHQQMALWVKSEYMQVAVSFILIGSAFALATGGAQVVSEVTRIIASESGNVELSLAANPGISDPNAIARAYIQNVIRCETFAYKAVFVINVWVETWSKLSRDIRGIEPAASGFVLTPYVTLYHFINNNITYLVLFHYIQHAIILVSEYTMLPVFLPIGLVLRAFPPTRGAGGFITAFSFGFAFVFPFSYVLIVALMPNAHGGCTTIQNLESSYIYRALEDETPCFFSASEQGAALFKFKKIEGTLEEKRKYIENYMGILFMQALFYPMASLIMTISFIRQAGSLFGADLGEIGRGLLKLL